MKRYYIDYTICGHLEVYAEDESEACDTAYSLIEDGDGCVDELTIDRIEDLEDDE